MAEGADEVVMMINAPAKVAEVNEMAMLYREPAMEGYRVDSGNETPRRSQQQAKAYCETNQRNENAKNSVPPILPPPYSPKNSVPEAHGPLFEGKWEMCASSEIEDSSGHVNKSSTSNGLPKCADSSSESEEIEDTAAAVSGGHGGDMGVCASTELANWQVDEGVATGTTWSDTRTLTS